KRIQHLLSNLDDRVLDLHFDLSLYLEPNDYDHNNTSEELIKHKSARSMLIHTLKVHNQQAGK
ncbi:hypothetical protein, partial [Vibrio parahaemolyticus]|uniref:hypothetical protein n=1 Tax=Vibrio parahaemolyticus TaxID=670 RepID=UPI001C5D2EB8